MRPVEGFAAGGGDAYTDGRFDLEIWRGGLVVAAGLVGRTQQAGDELKKRHSKGGPAALFFIPAFSVP